MSEPEVLDIPCSHCRSAFPFSSEVLDPAG